MLLIVLGALAGLLFLVLSIIALEVRSMRSLWLHGHGKACLSRWFHSQDVLGCHRRTGRMFWRTWWLIGYHGPYQLTWHYYSRVVGDRRVGR